jgi:type IV pilus assembly protein PilF
MRKLSLLMIMLPAVLMTACVSTPPKDFDSGNVEQAVSRQTSTSGVRQRAKVHTELGRLYLLEGRYEVALEEARVAVESESGYAPAHNLMGSVYMALRRNELAEQSFQHALQLASGDPEINNDYGWFLCQSGRAKESIPYFKMAIGNPLYQAPGRALTNAGVCALQFNSDAQAEDYLSRALRLDRANISALYWLADIAYRANRLADARQKLKDLHVVIEPTANSAWLALRVEHKLGDREGEARMTGIMRRKYRDSPEYQKLSRGEFD